MKVHENENNIDSQTHLDNNRDKFSNQCLKVLELLRQGKRLTTMNAPTYGILSLPRRIKDLKDRNGIHIDERWLEDEKGNRTVKEWFIEIKTDTQKKEMGKLVKLPPSTTQWKEQNLFNND